MMRSHPIDGIVRILTPENNTAGTGFVVNDGGLILTCAHILRDFYKPGDKVPVKFHIAKEQQRNAIIMPEYWRDSDAEDVAILRLEGNLPDGVHPLGLSSSSGSNGHSFNSFGYPEVKPEGMYGKCEVIGLTTENGFPVLQMQSGEVTRGFSGAPIWDDTMQVAIGMVSSITGVKPVPIFDRSGAPVTVPFDPAWRGMTTAFATPTETILKICPELQALEQCPYRGLKAFTEEDAPFFFGRQSVISELEKHLRDNPHFLAIFGQSGSGKSSVVRAGLIPRLQKGESGVRGSDRWDIIVTRPAYSTFRRDIANLYRFTRPIAMVIDQFEELFVVWDEAARAAREDIIANLVDILRTSPHITLVLVMRDDFYSVFMQYDALAAWTKGNLVHVSPNMEHSEIVSIVQEPAFAVRLQFEPGLVEKIVDDVLDTITKHTQKVGRSTILPLLEFALTQLWERRHDGILTRAEYDKFGGVTGGLKQQANDAYFSFRLPEKDLQPLVRRTFTDLVHFGDESQHIPDSRIRRDETSLVRQGDKEQDISEVVQKLVDCRLLVAGWDETRQKNTVEIIHDALLWEWEMLKRWISEDREFLVWRQKLEEKTQEWAVTDGRDLTRHDNHKLLGGGDLMVAQNWLTKREADLSQPQRDFIVASKKRRSYVIRMRTGIAIVAVVLIVGALVLQLVTQGNLLATQSKLLNSLPVSVTNLNDHGPGSLRDAIKNAHSGAVITFARNLGGTIRLTSGDIRITTDVAVIGPGASALAISGEHKSRVFTVNSNLNVAISNLTVKDGDVTHKSNVSFEASGGGIYTELLSALTLTNVVITGNAADFGGGIYNHTGNLTITNSTISNNTARGDGGGIESKGTLTITNSTISNNMAVQDAGGIDNQASLSLTNSTISGNTAAGDGATTGYGGGILNTGTADVIYTTLYGNKAVAGGGIANTITNQPENGFGVFLETSIVAGDTAVSGPDILGAATLYYPSLIQNTSGANFSSGPIPQDLKGIFELGKHSLLSESPKLAPLQNNGGPTQTYALLPGSPAIDQIKPDANDQICGSNSLFLTDQRGVPRPQGTGCDLGAYEYMPSQ